MLIATGTALVLAAWCLGGVVIAAVGLLPALAFEHGPATPRTLARALWWGLLWLAILAALLAVVAPLRSPATAAVLALVAVVGALLAARVIRRRGWSIQLRWNLGAGCIVAGLAVAVLVLAVSAPGPVTNYDTGLYHLGAIRYAMEHPAIAGLANLYGPLGYGHAEFTLAAVLGNGPLGAEGYRLLNGLIVLLACLDLVTRVLSRRWSAGTWVLLIGLTVSVTPMLVMADYWITSPSQDAAVLFVTVMASAYLVDALTGSRSRLSDAGVVLALAILLVMLRPTMGVFAITALAVLVIHTGRHRAEITASRGARAVMVGVGLGAVALAGAATVLRDLRLSGWLLYPLSILPFDVEWRAADPVGLREATLGYWRNPGDIWGSVDGWSWVGPWVAALPRLWEPYLLAVLVVAAATLLALAARVGVVGWRLLAMAMAPSAAATAAWWLLSPPGFRFGWGPLFTLLTIPIGWALWRITIRESRWRPALRRMVPIGALLLLTAMGTVACVWQTDWSSFSDRGTAQLGPVSLPFAIAPIVDARTRSVSMGSGVTLRMPEDSDQCWSVYPLCTPAPASGLRSRGPDWPDGFLP